jgi:subtilase-type serine protease
VGSNWLAGTTPTLEARPVFFAGTGGTSTHDAALASVSEIRFLAQASGSYVVVGAPLRLGADGIINESAYAQTVALDLTLTADSIVVTHTAPLIISGGIDTAGHMLVVDGDHDTQITGVIGGAGGLHKLDFGTLTLDGHNTYAGRTDVVFGTLRLDGSVLSDITVGTYGTLSGLGGFGGRLTLEGRLAPGASPGVLTQSAGDSFFETGARYVVEIGGVLAGTGDGFHDRFNIAAGSCNVAAGVTLEVLPWNTASATVFSPERGDVFTLLDARQGILGAFADLANPGHAHWVLYDDNATGIRYGNLYGTGLLGTQTLAGYGLSDNQRAVGFALHAAAVDASPSSTAANPAGFIDSSTAQGRVTLAVLAGASLDAFSPEAYLAVLDHALDANRSALDVALVAQPFVRSGNWSVGYTQERASRDRLAGTAIFDRRRYVSDNAVLRVGYEAGPLTTVGVVLGHARGSLGALESEGQTYGLTLVRRQADGGRWSFDAGIAWTDLAFDGTRAQVLGSSADDSIALEGVAAAARDVSARAFGCQANVRLAAYRSEKLFLGFSAGVVHGRARTDAFTESGDGALLAVDVAARESTKAVAGLNLALRPSAWLDLALTAGVEHEMGAVGADLGAVFAGERFTVADNPVARDISVLGLRVSSQLADAVSLQLRAEVRNHGGYDHDRRVSLNLTTRF